MTGCVNGARRLDDKGEQRTPPRGEAAERRAAGRGPSLKVGGSITWPGDDLWCANDVIRG